MSDETSSERLARLKDRLVETELLAQCGASFVNPHCLGYAKSLVKDFYTVSDSGEFVTTDRTPLNPRDLQPMAVSELGGWLQEMHGYLFRPETPSGVSTATTAAPASPPLNRAEMTVEQRAEFIHRHGGAAYMALPATPADALPLGQKCRSQMSVQERCEIIRQHGAEFYQSLPA